MKVLIEGKIPEDKWSRKLECEKCKSLLEIEEQDVYYVYDNGGYGGPSFASTDYYANCGLCKKAIRLTNLPSKIMNQAVSANFPGQNIDSIRRSN